MVELAALAVVELGILEAAQELLVRAVMAGQETLFIPFSLMEAVAVVQVVQAVV
jgi:hypothetical protein